MPPTGGPSEGRPASGAWSLSSLRLLISLPGEFPVGSLGAGLPTAPPPSGDSQPRASRGRRPDPAASSGWVQRAGLERSGGPRGTGASPRAPPGPLTACFQSFLAYPIHAKAQIVSSQM